MLLFTRRDYGMNNKTPIHANQMPGTWRMENGTLKLILESNYLLFVIFCMINLAVYDDLSIFPIIHHTLQSSNANDFT